MKDQVLAYISAHSGCTFTAVNDEVRDKNNYVDWIVTRREIDELIKEGSVFSVFDDGIFKLYAAKKPAV